MIRERSLRIALIDTTIRGSLGSMRRFRHQLEGALRQHASVPLEIEVQYIGLDEERFRRTPARMRMWRQHLHCVLAARRLDHDRFDVLHVLDGSYAYLASHLAPERTVATVHDIIPRLQSEGRFDGAPRVGHGARWMIHQSLVGISRCARICADSESTKSDLVGQGIQSPHEIQVIPLAIDPADFALPDREHSLSPPEANPFVLHLGNNGFYKNRVGAINVFANMPFTDDVGLVMAGPAPTAEIRQAVESRNLSGRIRFHVDPSPAELRSLYSSASVFLFPSLYEGFGWPPLEAMSAGCPVVCSDAGSLGEVVGDAAICCSPADTQSMANACSQLIRNQDLRQNLIEAGRKRVSEFDCRTLARAYSRIYREVAY